MTLRSNRRAAKPGSSPEEIEGSLDARGLRFGVVCARWNPTVTDAMLAAALETLERRGARPGDVTVVRVPGAWELPAAAAAMAGSRRAHAVVVLGAIVRGETTHHEVLAQAVSRALADLSAARGVPIGFGLLTCDTMDQARARVAKGAEAAESAITMARLLRGLRKR